MSFDRKLDQVLGRFKEIESLMSGGDLATDDFTKLSKEYSDITPIADSIRAYKNMQQEAEDLKEMLGDESLDKEMRTMAQQDLFDLEAKLPTFEHNIKMMLIPKDEADEKNAILEIRAGTGGDEAALFANDLYGMYKNYAANQGWRFEIVELSENDLGGIKQVVVKITGVNVFSKLKFESGVHRVQRVPLTETQGRVHTSAATVAVLPEAEEVDLKINDNDLRIDVFRASGAGGQHINKTESAVRITHIPTGLVVHQQDSRSQHANRDRAMMILRSRLYEKQRKELADARSAHRKEQVGSGDRSERIRTYNFPQGRVTDHRINLTLYKLEQVISGECLDELVDALIAEDNAEKMTDIAW